MRTPAFFRCLLTRITVGVNGDPTHKRKASGDTLVAEDHAPDHKDETQDFLQNHQIRAHIGDHAPDDSDYRRKNQIHNRLVAMKTGELPFVVHRHGNEEAQITQHS